jgi:excisionase family DNA binding protein
MGHGLALPVGASRNAYAAGVFTETASGSDGSVRNAFDVAREKKVGRLVGRLAVDVGEAAELLGVSRGYFDEHVRHEVRMVRKGRLRLVAVAELERWLERNSELILGDAGLRAAAGART